MRGRLNLANPVQALNGARYFAVHSLGYYVAMRCNKLWGYSSLRSASSPRLALRISPRETSENARRQLATSSHQLVRTPRLSRLPSDRRKPSRNCSVEEETPFHGQTPQEWGEVGETLEPRGRLQERVGANSMLSHRKFVLVTLAVFSRNKRGVEHPFRGKRMRWKKGSRKSENVLCSFFPLLRRCRSSAPVCEQLQTTVADARKLFGVVGARRFFATSFFSLRSRTVVRRNDVLRKSLHR